MDWAEVLGGAHERLRHVVGTVDSAGLRAQSCASEWTVAQVLSHLGSGAEIFGLILDAAEAGREAPAQDEFAVVWDRWNAKSPDEQAADSLAANEAFVKHVEGIDPARRDTMRVSAFGMDLDFATVAQMRLNELALHTWDIAATADPAATVAPEAVELIIDTLAFVVSHSAKPQEGLTRLHVSTTAPEREFELTFGETSAIAPGPATGDGPRLTLPAEAFIRLVYGRLDPSRTPPGVETSGGADLDTLRRTFPGF